MPSGPPAWPVPERGWSGSWPPSTSPATTTGAPGTSRPWARSVHPPDVAGWRGDARWTSSTASLGRGSWICWFEPPDADRLIATGAAASGGDDLVDTVLDRCSLSEVSRRTRQALRATAAELLPFDPDADPRPAVVALLRLATLTPEFAAA